MASRACGERGISRMSGLRGPLFAPDMDNRNRHRDNPLPPVKAILTIREAAAAIGVKPDVVGKLVRSGALEGLRLGPLHRRVTRISGASLRRLVGE